MAFPTYVSSDPLTPLESLFNGLATPGNSLETTVTTAFGAWQSWTPTYTNISTTGLTLVRAKYAQFGKTVFCTVSITLGTTTPISGNPTFSLPVTAAYTTTAHAAFGFATLRAASNAYPGIPRLGSTSTVNLVCEQVSGSNITFESVTASVPFTWASGHTISFWLCYEAA